jgi:hypothetical protein
VNFGFHTIKYSYEPLTLCRYSEEQPSGIDMETLQPKFGIKKSLAFGKALAHLNVRLIWLCEITGHRFALVRKQSYYDSD